MATYEYFQPEYVSKFKCDGQTCAAYCCRSWAITIDKKNYKKYSHLKPKSAAREITRNITANDELNSYIIKMDENNRCPFLTEDNLCGIQKKYGEEILSETCATYPRITWNIGNFYERSLSLTCPVVAKQALFATEPMKFERIEVSEKVHSNFGKFFIRQNLLPSNSRENFVSVQETEIKILQERSLTIDQRLLMLGLYYDKLDELITDGLIHDIERFNPTYQNKTFLQEQAAQFSAVLKFEPLNYMEVMIGLFEILFGKDKKTLPKYQKFTDALIDTLQIKTEENNNIRIGKLTEKYMALDTARQKLLNQFSTVFENYLVNETFLYLYPFRFEGSTIFNYSVFASVYKMLELLIVSIYMTNENFDESELIEAIGWYTRTVNHDISYLNKFAKDFDERRNILEIVQSMLQL